MPKSKKGTVSIGEDRGWLRLRFRHEGERYTLALSLIDNDVNRAIAAERARKIELDIQAGHFDKTLERYKPHRIPDRTQTNLLTVQGIFQQFIDFKAKSVYPRTLEKYHALLKHLQTFRPKGSDTVIGDKPAALLEVMLAEQFHQYLKGKLADRTLKEWLGLVSACWDWGMGQQLLNDSYNPWKELVDRVKVAPKQKSRPFSREEIQAIVAEFRKDPHYHWYTDYVEFLLGTGCRTAEAIGLRWRHVSDDCLTVWIGETLSRRVRKPTKTNKDRTIRLNPRLQTILQARKPDKVQPDDLVFKTRRGCAIDDQNFRNRAWKTILNRLGVEYRKPYNTRHTVVSHAIKHLPPAAVAEITGHDVRTLYRDYAANTEVFPVLPNLVNESDLNQQ